MATKKTKKKSTGKVSARSKQHIEFIKDVETLLIDGLPMAYRNESSLGFLKTSQGESSGMWFGFMRSLLALQKEFPSAKRIVVVWDTAKKVLKSEGVDGYKGNRPVNEVRSSVHSKVGYLRYLLERTKFTQVHADGYEADDVLYNLSGRPEFGLSTIVTVDSDLFAALGGANNTLVYMTQKKELHSEEMFVNQHGYLPCWYSLMKSVLGDSSDNLKGVKNKQQVFDAIKEEIGLRDLNSDTNLIFREVLKRFGVEGQFDENYKAIGMVEVPLSAMEWTLGRSDEGELMARFKELEFNSFLTRMGEFIECP